MFKLRRGIWLMFLICLGQLESVAQNNQDAPPPPNWWKRNFSINGGLGANLMSYHAWGIPPRTRPGTWMMNVNLNIRLGQFNMPLGVIFSEQERTFMQPFNQYGISPGFKWMRAHVGYRSMTFSTYTLNGVVFLGGGIELNPGKFRFSCMYGRINRAVAEDTLSDNRTFPAFKRMGLGFKVGWGDSRKYFDLIFFQASDELNSLPYVPVKTKITPEDNKVFGLNHRFSKGKFFWENDGAISLFTRDVRDSLTPIKTDIKLVNRIGAWINPTISTQLSTAFHSAIGLQFNKFQFRLQYKRISPNYRSLGTFYILGDMENITASPSFLFFKNTLRVALSAGYQRDNTSGFKYNTTVRSIGACNISYTPNANVSTEISINNFGTTQAPGLYPVEDTLRQYQVTRSINVMQRFGKNTKEFSKNFMITAAYQTFTDFNAASRSFLQNSVYTGAINYNYSIVASKLSMGGGIMSNQITGAGFSSFQIGPTANCSKGFLKNKITLNGGISALYNTNNGEAQGLNFNVNASGNYRLTKRQRISAGLFAIRSNRFAGSTDKFSELRFNLGYNYSF